MLLSLAVVEHFNIDTEGITEVSVISGVSAEEIGEDAHDLGENIWLRSVFTLPESLDKSVTLDGDLSLGHIRSSRGRFTTMGRSSLLWSLGRRLSRWPRALRVVKGTGGAIRARCHIRDVETLDDGIDKVYSSMRNNKETL